MLIRLVPGQKYHSEDGVAFAGFLNLETGEVIPPDACHFVESDWLNDESRYEEYGGLQFVPVFCVRAAQNRFVGQM